jgi:hypothetical protein
MLTDRPQIVLPLTWTHVTTKSFTEMAKTWTQSWNETGRLTKSQYKVLRALAFKVNLTGAAFIRQDTLAEDLEITRRTVERAIPLLESLGLIEILKGNDREKKFGRMNNYRCRFDRGPTAEGYEPTPYFLSLLEPVGEPATPQEDHCRADVGPMSAECRTDTSYTPETTERKIDSTSYYPARSAGSNLARGPQIRGATDPPPAVGGSLAGADTPISSVSESPATASVRDVSTRRSKTRSRTLNPDSAMGLAATLQEALRASEGSSDRHIDFDVLKPLAKKISGWLKAGKSPDTIRKMIDLYEGYRSEPGGWKDFVYKRDTLFAETQRLEQADQNADSWTRLAAKQAAEAGHGTDTGVWK